MSPEFLFTIVMSALTVLGSVYGTRYQLQKGSDDARAVADEAIKRATSLAEENTRLWAKVNDATVRIARQEILQEQHGKELERGLARIEAAVVALHARLDNALSQRGERQA